MEIIFLDPPYSSLFNDLAVRIEGKGINVGFFDPTYANKIYFPSVKRSGRCWPRRELLTAEEILSVKCLANSEADFSPKEVLIIQNYLHVLSEHIGKNTTFIMYNDCRWNHAMVIAVCKKWGLKYMVLERGAFRGHTCSIDSAGCNARSNYRLADEHHHSNDILADVVFRSRAEQPLVRVRFAIYLTIRVTLNWLSGYHTLNRSRNSVWHYIRQKLQRTKPMAQAELPLKRFVFVPLQMNNDSQLMLSNPRFTNEALLDWIRGQCISHGIPFDSVVVKRHPLDTNYYDHPFRESHSDADVLLRDCARVITINSTVGFEGLLCDKPVYCLAESFYTFDNWVYKCSQFEYFLTAEKSKVSPEFIRQSIIGQYSFPGDVFNYDGTDVEVISDVIMSYLTA